jgi:light-harvesting protein B-800-850 alpha chain
MNNGKMWCIVNPTVGIPLFLGGVAAISMIVHHAVMNNTTWVNDFFQGGAPRTTAALTTDGYAPASMTLSSGQKVAVTPVAANDGSTQFMITVTPSTTNPVVSASLPAGNGG